MKKFVAVYEEMSPAQIVVGDNPGLFSYGDNENSFEKTGLMESKIRIRPAADPELCTACGA